MRCAGAMLKTEVGRGVSSSGSFSVVRSGKRLTGPHFCFLLEDAWRSAPMMSISFAGGRGMSISISVASGLTFWLLAFLFGFWIKSGSISGSSSGGGRESKGKLSGGGGGGL